MKYSLKFTVYGLCRVAGLKTENSIPKTKTVT